MDKPMEAYYRREERYEGLQVVFWNQEQNREKVLNVIESAKKKHDTNPNVFENCYKDEPDKCAFYIEFNDDYDKIAGDFFESILCDLGIKSCS